jgi:hypothetical protein
MSNFSLFECENTVVRDYPSPDLSKRFVVFERSCGATTGFSTQISLLSGSDPLENEAGDTFTADTDDGKAPAGPGGGPEVRVTWLGADSARIEYHPSARVFKAERGVRGIAVEYQKFDVLR